MTTLKKYQSLGGQWHDIQTWKKYLWHRENGPSDLALEYLRIWLFGSCLRLLEKDGQPVRTDWERSKSNLSGIIKVVSRKSLTGQLCSEVFQALNESLHLQETDIQGSVLIGVRLGELRRSLHSAENESYQQSLSFFLEAVANRKARAKGGKEGGETSKQLADRWRIPMLVEAKELRRQKPSLSQEQLTDKLVAANISTAPARGQIKETVRQWEKSGDLPRSTQNRGEGIS